MKKMKFLGIMSCLMQLNAKSEEVSLTKLKEQMVEISHHFDSEVLSDDEAQKLLAARINFAKLPLKQFKNPLIINFIKDNKFRIQNEEKIIDFSTFDDFVSISNKTMFGPPNIDRIQ